MPSSYRRSFRHSTYDMDVSENSDSGSGDNAVYADVRSQASSGNSGRRLGAGMGNYRDSVGSSESDSVRQSAVENAKRFLWDDEDIGPVSAHAVPTARSARGADPRNSNNARRVGSTRLSDNPVISGVDQPGSVSGFLGIFQRGTGLSPADYNDAYFHDAARSSPDDMEEYISHKPHAPTVPCLANRRRALLFGVLAVLAVVGVFRTTRGREFIDIEGGSWEERAENDRYHSALDNLKNKNTLSSSEHNSQHMTQTGTPQNKALEWTVVADPLELPTDSSEFRLRYLFATVYFATGGDDTWKEDRGVHWLSDRHICEWEGVVCDKQHQPYGLNLSDYGCSGTLPVELFEIPLVSLDLSNNAIDGPIPVEISETVLANVYISNNLLVGTIPTEIYRMQALRRLVLNNNRLSGNIPQELSMQRPPLLQGLDLSNNNLKGHIPDFSKYPEMEFLVMHDNEFTGSILNNIGVLSNLKELRFNNNRLTGTIPRTLAVIKKLEIIDLSNNYMRGTIPDIISGLFHLEELNLHSNNFSGNLPRHLLDSKNYMLHTILLHKNKFSGAIPNNIGRLVKLETLRYDENQLVGSIPPSIASMTNLKELRLNDNALTGTIPTRFGTLTKMETFHLERNQVHGYIPSEMGTMTSMTSLRMHDNRFTGVVPTEMCNDMSSIQYLSVDCDDTRRTTPGVPYVACSCCTRCF